GFGSAPAPMGWCAICSTPPAMMISATPDLINDEPMVWQVMPPAHILSTENPGTVSGSPAVKTTVLPIVVPWSPIWVVAPQILSSTSPHGTVGFLLTSSFMILVT